MGGGGGKGRRQITTEMNVSCTKVQKEVLALQLTLGGFKDFNFDKIRTNPNEGPVVITKISRAFFTTLGPTRSRQENPAVDLVGRD